MAQMQTPQQQALPLDLPLLTPEQRMRDLFNTRWRRWHRCATYEEAVKDPFTHRLLALAVAHAPAQPTPRRRHSR